MSSIGASNASPLKLLNHESELIPLLKNELLSLGSDEELKVNEEVELGIGNNEKIRAKYFWLYRKSIVNVLTKYGADELSVKVSILGLWKAAQKYDYHRGYRFLSYAVYWVQASIQKKNYLNIELVNRISSLKK